MKFYLFLKSFFSHHGLIVLGLLLIIPALWPIFNSQFFHMHDWLHVARLVELDTALKAGQFPPRWAPDFGWGYGMPLLHFYPPLPYYLAEILYLLKLPAVAAVKAIFALNFFFGFYFMYLWAKDHWGKWGGFLSAISFAYLPYRAVHFYVRGSLAELTAMTFLPLLFYAIGRKKILLSALSLAAIFLSHNIISLFTLIVLGFFFIFNLKDWKFYLIFGLLAVGLSSFFILPAFIEKDLTVVSSLAGGYSHYSLHFIYLRQLLNRFWGYGGSVLGLEDNMSFQLGWPQVIFVLLFALSLLKKPNRTHFLYLAIFGLSVFLMTFHSQFIWKHLSILHIAQFPWRWLSVAATFAALFAGVIGKKVLLLPLVLVTIWLNLGFFKPDLFIDPNTLYFTDRSLIKNTLGDVLPDYLPTTAIKPAIPAETVFNFNDPINLQLASASATTLPQYYFPGWYLLDNGQPQSIYPDKTTGLIAVDLPAGSHQLLLTMQKTPLQRLSDIISLLTWIGVLTYGIKKLWTK